MSAVNRITYSVRLDKKTGEWLTVRHSAKPSVIIARSATRLEALEVAWSDPFTPTKTIRLDQSLIGHAIAPYDPMKGK